MSLSNRRGRPGQLGRWGHGETRPRGVRLLGRGDKGNVIGGQQSTGCEWDHGFRGGVGFDIAVRMAQHSLWHDMAEAGKRLLRGSRCRTAGLWGGLLGVEAILLGQRRARWWALRPRAAGKLTAGASRSLLCGRGVRGTGDRYRRRWQSRGGDWSIAWLKGLVDALPDRHPDSYTVAEAEYRGRQDGLLGWTRANPFASSGLPREQRMYQQAGYGADAAKQGACGTNLTNCSSNKAERRIAWNQRQKKRRGGNVPTPTVGWDWRILGHLALSNPTREGALGKTRHTRDAGL